MSIHISIIFPVYSHDIPYEIPIVHQYVHDIPSITPY
jgi:hypothetical protein